MSKFSVKVTGPFMEIYQYLRKRGYGIQDAKFKAKQQPSIIEFETFDEFVDCVKWFHREPFMVESNCDFEYDMTGFVGGYVPSEEEIELSEEFYNEIHLSNIEMINAIIAWQKDDKTHLLTCGNDSNHTILWPAIDTDTNTVVLACKDCDYVQNDIPPVVLERYKLNLNKEKNGTSENNPEDSGIEKRS